MVAWYQVQPSSGRMIGMLPNGNHAGMSDEVACLAQTGLDRARERLVSEVGGGSAVTGFFGQLAGMYVSTAGILEGVTLTFCNPALAEMDSQDWQKFLALHALDHSQQFQEDHADQYDSYAAQLSFWQGAMVLTSALSGKDAVRDVARRAMEGVREKAQKDLETYAGDLKNKAGDVGKKELEKAIRDRSRRLGQFLKGIRNTSNSLTGG